jgi:hypothetical protein
MLRLMILILVFGLAAPAFAGDEPKHIDFTQPFVDEGKPIIDDIACPLDRAANTRPCETPFTLGEATYRALRAPEQGISFDEATKRDDLSRAIRKATDWPLLAADRDLIKKVLAKVFPSPALLGPAGKMLAGEGK